MALFHKLNVQVGAANPMVAQLRCPHCGHLGAFHGLTNCNDVSWIENVTSGSGAQGLAQFHAGARRCPNPVCLGLVQIVLKQAEAVESYPPQVIDFDPSNLPASILAAFEEAVKAHAAGCFRAAALMVRRVLEELCDDKKAVGTDLKKRLAALGQAAIIPQELLDAADELRLLGNDAAHIKAKDYDSIGPAECLLAIELTKELLKAVYQYASLVSRLRALKKPAP